MNENERYSEKLSRQNIFRQPAKAPCENSSSPKEGKLRPRLKPEKYLFALTAFLCIVDHITDYVLRLLFANLPLHLNGLFCALASQHRLDLLLSVPLEIMSI